MCFVQISSNNPNFSYVIRKNPDDPKSQGIRLLPLRKGIIIGWYVNRNRYNVYFKEGDNEISFPKNPENDGNYDYNSIEKYCSPVIPLSIITQFFKATISVDKFDLETDILSDNKFYIASIQIKKLKLLKQMKKCMESQTNKINIDFTQVNNDIYSLKFSNNRTMYELLNFVNIFLTIIIYSNEIYYPIRENDLKNKYLDCLNAFDAPYYIRYLFKLYIIKSNKIFETISERLNTNNINITFSSNFYQRSLTIGEHLDFNKSIVDIGCGEGSYVTRYVNKLRPDCKYYCFDIDKDMLFKLELKLKRKDPKLLENKKVQIYDDFNKLKDNLNEISNSERYNIILTEVVEHMSIKEAENLIKKVLDSFTNFYQFIITTPNHDFNKYYHLDENEFRDEDHKWEMTDKEFIRWINKITYNYNLQKKCFIGNNGIGDKVNGSSSTSGIIIYK